MDNLNKDNLLKEVVKIAAKEGAKEALRVEAQRKEKEKKDILDSRLHNVRLLLKNFRSLKEHSESAVYSSLQKSEIIDIVKMMWDPNNRSEYIVEAIKQSAIKTNIIIAHITTGLEQYKQVCYHSSKLVDRDRVDVLFARYIDEPELTVEELAKKLKVDKRTVYNYLDTATEELTAFMFGVDGLIR